MSDLVRRAEGRAEQIEMLWYDPDGDARLLRALCVEIATLRAEVSRLRKRLVDTAAGVDTMWTPGYRSTGPRVCSVCGRPLAAVERSDRHEWCGGQDG